MDIYENHKRPIETAFWMLDKLLCKLERWAKGNEIHSLLYNEHNILLDKQRLQLQDEIVILQKLLKQVKVDLQLQGFTLNLGRAIQGGVMLFADNLEELKGHNLEDYGKPAKELVTYLDPMLEQFIKHLLRISHIGTEAIKTSKENLDDS